MYVDWNFVDEVDKLFGELTKGKVSSWQDNFPALDSIINENSGDMVLRFALAGYGRDNITLTLEGDMLHLAGKLPENSGEKYMRYLKRGIRRREFNCKYQLPNGKYELAKAKASFDNGILEIVIPPAENHKPRQLQIN